MKFGLVVIFLFCINYVIASRILVCVPTPSISHQIVFHRLISEFLNRGHEVVYITTDSMYPKGEAPANLTEINSHDASYQLWKDFIMTTKTTTGSRKDQLHQVTNIFRLIGHSFEKQVLHQEFQDLVKGKVHFDLLIIEACAKAALSLSHIFKAPVILMSSYGSHLDNYELLGAPKYPKMLYLYSMHQKVNNLTLLEKIRVLLDIYQIETSLSRVGVEDSTMVARLFGPDMPSLEELGDNVDMLFLNVYPIWEFNRPVPPGVIFIGGIHQSAPQKLPQDLKTYLDSSQKGVVYFSLGSNVRPSTLSTEMINTLVNGLAKLQYDVLVKWDHDSLPGQGSNMKVAKWLPQADLLRHPNVKAFITQGGLQSFDEALTGGVPFVGIPMLGDQWYNVELFERFKIGVGLLMDELTEDKLVNAVNTVINDSSYRHNVVDLRNRVRDQPASGLERAVWWSEHVLRHGGARHLRAPAANISWSAYLDLPLLATLAIIALTAIAAATTALYLFLRYLRTLLSAFTHSKLKVN